MILKQPADTLRKPANPVDDDDEFSLDTRVKPVVRILNGALDEDEHSAGGIVLNGRIDPATLRFLKVDNNYQRPLAERPEIFDAIKSGTVVPNIDVGVRGQDFTTEGDDFAINSPAYIIDGWQRVGNALRVLELIPDFPVRIFATVHFGTDELWERHRFTELNKNVKKVSPNLHLRNMRDGNEAVLTLYGLSNNTKDFPLYGKVCWSQNMRRGELMSAMQLAKVALRVHGHVAPLTHGSVITIADGLLKATKSVTLGHFRKNIHTYFSAINDCWGIHQIEFTHAAPQIKTTFMFQLARMFSLHVDFWDEADRSLTITSDLRRKLSKFPINDPHVRSLAGTGGAAANILYDLLVSHMNSGKRTHRLRSRYEASQGAAA